MVRLETGEDGVGVETRRENSTPTNRSRVVVTTARE